MTEEKSKKQEKSSDYYTSVFKNVNLTRDDYLKVWIELISASEQGKCEGSFTEQKARVTYDNLIRMVDDPDVREPLKFLRARIGALPTLLRTSTIKVEWMRTC